MNKSPLRFAVPLLAFALLSASTFAGNSRDEPNRRPARPARDRAEQKALKEKREKARQEGYAKASQARANAQKKNEQERPPAVPVKMRFNFSDKEAKEQERTSNATSVQVYYYRVDDKGQVSRVLETLQVKDGKANAEFADVAPNMPVNMFVNSELPPAEKGGEPVKRVKPIMLHPPLAPARGFSLDLDNSPMPFVRPKLDPLPEAEASPEGGTAPEGSDVATVTETADGGKEVVLNHPKGRKEVVLEPAGGRQEVNLAPSE